MNKNKDLTHELVLIKSPKNELLNLNIRSELSDREKAVLVVTSRTFTFFATLFTCGIYYIYYYFCLCEFRENPFDLLKKGKKYEREDFKIVPKEQTNAQNFSNSYSRLLEKDIKCDSFKREFLERFNHYLVNLGVVILVVFSCFENIFSKITRQKLKKSYLINTKEKRLDAYVEDMEDILSQKTYELRSKKNFIDNEFDFGESMIRNFSNGSINRISNYYLKFLFFFGWIFISLLTLGIVPIYWFFKNKKIIFFDFHNIIRRMEVRSFNDVVGRLVSCQEFEEFSEILFREDDRISRSNATAHLFKTNLFKDPKSRRKVILVLSFLSFGLFGILISFFGAFCKKNNLNDIDEKSLKSHYDYKLSFGLRFKFKLNDLLWDLRMLFKLLILWDFKIIDEFKRINKSESRFMSRLVNLIGNKFYFLIFSILPCLPLLFLPLSFSYAALFVFCVIFLIFVGLRSIHLSLFFS